MNRTFLEMPSTFPFSTELSIRVGDLNYGGHLGNDSLLSLLQEARVTFLKSLGGKNEGDVFGLGLIMTDSVVVYKSEGFQGDRIKIEIAVGDLSRTRFDLFYHATNLTTGKILSQAKTGMAFFDYEARRLQPIPEDFKRRFQK